MFFSLFHQLTIAVPEESKEGNAVFVRVRFFNTANPKREPREIVARKLP